MSIPKTAQQKLWEKIYKARKEAEPIVKKGTSDDGSFDFARFEEVLAAASKLLDKHRLIYIARMADEQLYFGKSGCLAKAVFEYEVIDLSAGGSTVIRWAGTGFDSPGGAALFKAETGAEKYFLARLLRIPWGTDPEVGNGTASVDTERGARLKAAMEEQGWTAASLGERIGVEAGTVERWRDGGPIADKHRSALAGTLGMSRVRLMTGEDEPERIRREQDEAAEAPQVERKFSHLRPVPESDLPEPDWSGLKEEIEEVPADV